MVRKLALFAALAAVAACGGGNGNVSFSVRAGSSTAGAVRPGPNALTVTSGIQISRIRIALRDVKLESSTGSSSDDSDDAEIRTGPMVLDLQGAALDNASTTTVVNASIKPGTYREVKFKIHKPSSSESSDAAVQAMAAANASVIVDGTIDGAASFTFVSEVEAEQELEHTLVLADGSNLTLNIDPSGWFGASVASRLDPRVSGNRSQIESNIKASFRAFEDNDHDGHDDD